MTRTRTAVVTGAARGIGRAIAEELLGRGYRVFCWDIDLTNLQTSIDHWETRFPGCAVAVECDISSEASVAQAVVSLGGEPLGILVNNAAAWRPHGTLASIGEERWNTDLAVLLGGPQRVAAALDGLLENGAAMVTIASVHGINASPYWGTYDVAKAALIQWSRVKAAELGTRGITANVVAPGVIIETEYEDRELEVFHTAAGIVPRAGTPADVARAVAFLSDPDNSFITGALLVVDGGMTSRLALSAQEAISTWPAISRGDHQ